MLPLPQCLDSAIKLRIPYAPQAEDATPTTWVVLTIPTVQPLTDNNSQRSQSPLDETLSSSSKRQLSQSKRNSSRTSLFRRNSVHEGYPADDELAVESDGTEESDDSAETIEGSFPATSSITVRWAPRAEIERAVSAPVMPARHVRSRSTSTRGGGRSFSSTSSRAKVGVEHVESAARYTIYPLREVVGARNEYDTTVTMERWLPVAVEFSARCVGFSHPGVATALALEIMLDDQPEGQSVQWDESPLLDSKTSSVERFTGDWTFSGSGGIPDWGWERSAGSADTGPSSHGSRRSVRQADSDPQEPSNAEYRSGLGRSDTLLSDDSPFRGSRQSGQRHPSDLGGDSVTLDRNFPQDTSLMRVPLPAPSLLDDSFDDPRRRNPPISRESTGPMYDSQWSATSSRYSRATGSDVSGRSGTAARSLSRTHTEIDDGPASSSVPSLSVGDLDPTLPSHPILLEVDLHNLLTTQRVPNPKMASATFTFKGRILVPVPDAESGDAISIGLPMFRLARARDHECKVHVMQAPGNTASKPFVVRFHAGEPRPVDPVVQGEVIQTLQIPPFQDEAEPAPIALAMFIAPSAGKGRASQSSSKLISSRAATSSAVPEDRSGPSLIHSAQVGIESQDPNNAISGSSRSVPVSSPYASAVSSPSLQPSQQQETVAIAQPASFEDLYPSGSLVIASVDLNVILGSNKLTQDNKSQGTSYTVHMRSSWPSHPSGELAPNQLQFKLTGPSSSRAEMRLRSATFSGSAVPCAYQPHDDNGQDRLVQITLLSGSLQKAGFLEVIYSVDLPTSKGRHELLLPSFASPVALMTLCIEESPGKLSVSLRHRRRGTYSGLFELDEAEA